MKRDAWQFLAGWGLGIITAMGCASTFPYQYYNAQMPSDCYDSGKLLGKLGNGGWPDLSLQTCKPDPAPSPGESTVPNLMKCATMKIDDFYSLKADNEKCHSDLSLCQAGPAPQ